MLYWNSKNQSSIISVLISKQSTLYRKIYFSHWTGEYTLIGYKGCTCGSSGRWCRAEVKCRCCCGCCWGSTFMDKPLKRSVGTTGSNNTPSCAICSVVDHILVVVFLPLINADTFCGLKQDVILCYLKHRVR